MTATANEIARETERVVRLERFLEHVADWRTSEVRVDRQAGTIENIVLGGPNSRNGYRYKTEALRDAVGLEDLRARPFPREHAAQREARIEIGRGHADEGGLCRQLALGGGSPTFLTPDRLERLMRSLAAVWTLTADAEVSVEIDPRTATAEHLEVMLAHGFNRFSLGVQDFDAIKLLKFAEIGRASCRERV